MRHFLAREMPTFTRELGKKTDVIVCIYALLLLWYKAF